ncbi:MAG TPA: flagellar hook-length control protein FliK [Burkholderiaceae bacterium]|nr:flagellar hook-length control protein FliK [Burkholderiaceae bacterium]
MTETTALTPSSPLSAAASVGPNPVQGALGNITQAAVGQLFQAQVLSQLEDGTFLVNVGDNALRMALPAGTNVGGTLPMTLLATDPRPAFLLEQQNDGSSALLSNAAKVINTALQSAQQSGAPTAIVGKTPLLTTPTADTPQIAGALQDGIEFSGVFYESHVGQWADGERALADLMLEPQTQVASQGATQAGAQNQASAAATAGKSQASNAPTVLQRPATSDTELSRLIDNAVTSASNGQTKLSQAINTLLNTRNLPQEADTLVRTPTLTQETAQNINLQLNTLEQHRIAWQGELWPGQQFEWEVSDETSRGGQQGDASEGNASWQSVVRFELPTLGKVSATINLAGGHVQIRVNTASQGSAALLKAHGDELASAMDAAGSPLDSLIIKQDEQT